ACYQARLFTCADRLLEASLSRFGPRVAGEAGALREQIRRTLTGEIKSEAVDWYLGHGAGALKDQRLTLARLYAEEARALGGRREDCYRCGEAEALAAEVRAAAA